MPREGLGSSGSQTCNHYSCITTSRPNGGDGHCRLCSARPATGTGKPARSANSAWSTGSGAGTRRPPPISSRPWPCIARSAADHHRQALALYRETDDHPGEGEAEALNGRGETLLAVGQPGKAHAQHAVALRAAGQVGDRYQQARAHAGLDSACHAYGDLDQARRHWQQAHTCYTELGVPEAGNILAHLAALDDVPPNNNNKNLPMDDT